MRPPAASDAKAFASFIAERGALLAALQPLVKRAAPLDAQEQQWARQVQDIAHALSQDAHTHLQALGAQLRSVQEALGAAGHTPDPQRGRLVNKLG